MAEDDAALIVACAGARAAVAAYNAEAERDEPGDLAGLFERERLALECVAASRARTPAGIAEGAAAARLHRDDGDGGARRLARGRTRSLAKAMRGDIQRAPTSPSVYIRCSRLYNFIGRA